MSPYKSIQKQKLGSGGTRVFSRRDTGAPLMAMLVGAVIGVGVGFAFGYVLRLSDLIGPNAVVVAQPTPKMERDWRKLEAEVEQKMRKTIEEVSPGYVPEDRFMKLHRESATGKSVLNGVPDE